MDAKKLFSSKIDRRRMLGNLGMMGAGAVLTACGGAIGQKPDPKATDYDAAILNFALNLEYLEAAFYLAAVGRIGELPGYTPEKVLVPTGFDPTAGISFPDPAGMNAAAASVGEYANEIATDELAHVVFLRKALGTSAGDLPTLDLNASFKGAAAAAFGLVADPASLGLPAGFTPEQFEPLSDNGPISEALFLHGAFIFEDVGVTAYKGAAKFITNPDTLEAAAGILAVEAYHASEVRTFLYGADKRRADIYGGLDTWTIVSAISAARNALGGGEDFVDQGIVAEARFGLSTQAHGGANIVPTDPNGIAPSRTPRQVANIVFLNPDNAALKGGFFPNGISIPANLLDQTLALLDPTFPANL
ncbi:ferritin-like domain-containing protein [soil metagenome]